MERTDSKLWMGSGYDPALGPQTTLDSLLVLTDQTLQYEQARKSIDEQRMQAALSGSGPGLLDPVQQVLSNQVPPLPRAPPNSLAYYSVEDAAQQPKVLVPVESPQPSRRGGRQGGGKGSLQATASFRLGDRDTDVPATPPSPQHAALSRSPTASFRSTRRGGSGKRLPKRGGGGGGGASSIGVASAGSSADPARAEVASILQRAESSASLADAHGRSQVEGVGAREGAHPGLVDTAAHGGAAGGARRGSAASVRWQKAITFAKGQQKGARAKQRRRSQLVTPEMQQIAEGLVTQGKRTLLLLLEDKTIQRAAAKAGIDLEELRPLPFSHFRTEPNSPVVRDKAAQELAFRLYQRGRVRKIGMILVEVSAIKAEREAEAKRRRAMEERVVGAFWDALQTNDSIMSKAELSTSKAQRVLVNENQQIKARFAQAEREAQKFIQRRVAIEQDVVQRAEAMRALGRRKQIVIEKYRESAEHQDAVKAARIQHNIAVKEMRLQAKLAKDAAVVEEKARRKQELIKHRQEIRDRTMRRQERERDRMRVVLKAKHAGLDEIKERTAREMAARQAERSLLAKEKVARVAMQRKEQEYQHQQAAKKTKEWSKRIELIDELRRAAAVERGARQHEALIAKHRFQAANPVLRNVTPGPGAYEAAGGAFDPKKASEEAAAAAGSVGRAHGARRSKSAGGLDVRRRSRSPDVARSVGPSPSLLASYSTGRGRDGTPAKFDRLLAESMSSLPVPAMDEGQAAGDTDDEGDGGGRRRPPSPSGGMSHLLNSSNLVEKYRRGNGPQAADMSSIFSPVKPTGRHPGSVGRGTSSSPTPSDFTRSFTLPPTSPDDRHRPDSRASTTGSRRSGRRRQRGRSKRDSLEKLYEPPPVPYTAVRSVEALGSQEVSEFDEAAYVGRVARARATLRQERRAKSTLGRRSYIDDVSRVAARLPGPGEYVRPAAATSPVAKWGDQSPKSDVEWQIYRAKQLPGPGEYPNVQPLRHTTAARFGRNNPKSEFDWIEMRAKKSRGRLTTMSPSSGRRDRCGSCSG